MATTSRRRLFSSSVQEDPNPQPLAPQKSKRSVPTADSRTLTESSPPHRDKRRRYNESDGESGQDSIDNSSFDAADRQSEPPRVIPGSSYNFPDYLPSNLTPDARTRATSSPPVLSPGNSGFLRTLDPQLRAKKTPVIPTSSHLIPRGYNTTVSSQDDTTFRIPTNVFPSAKPASRKQVASEKSALKNQFDSVVVRLEKLERESVVTKTALDELPHMYDRIEDMNLKIENLESALLASTSGQILSDKDQQVVIQARDNNINSMLRAVMYSLMAISNQDTSVLPDPVFKNSGGASVFWVPTGIPDEEALRPNFNVSWTKNKPWHSQFLAKVHSDGNSLYPSCSTDVIAGLQDKDILTRGSRTTFKHLKEKYQVQGKSDRERDLDKQFKRRDGRKKIKATTRSAVREQYPSLEDSRYDFIFHTAFQSTDCSTDLTSNSEGDNDLDDDDTPKIKTLKSWPPEYRDQNYLDLIDDIDVRSKSFATSEKTSKKTSKNTKRSSGYVYLRAKQKKRSTTSIPRPEHGPKILCCFIEEKWLEKQPERNRKEMGKFVLGSDDEGYDEDWEVFPSWEKFNKKGKGKQK